MTSCTRSGRILKQEGTSSTKSGDAAAKVKDTKDSPTSRSTATTTKNKANNTTTAKEARSLKTSSPSSRKSGRLDAQASSTPPDKKQKKRSRSPLRRSERIEKNAVSSSPDSKKLNESSGPPSKKKKLHDDKNGVTGTDNESKDNNLDIKISEISKKKTGTPRRYRALLKSKLDEISDEFKVDIALNGNCSKSTSSNSKKMSEGLDECNGKKEDTLCRKYSVDSSKEAAEGCSSGSRDLDDLTVDDDRLKKSTCTSGKKKIVDKSPVSKCNGISKKSSPVGLSAKNNGGCVSQREMHGMHIMHHTHEVCVEKLTESELIASTSEGKSLAVDASLECRVNFKGSKNGRTSTDVYSGGTAIAGTRNGSNTEISKADVTSSPCEATYKDVKRCTACNKLERVHNVSEDHELCLCNSRRESKLTPSTIEEPCGIVSSPCQSETEAICLQGNYVEGNLMPEVREHSPRSKKQHCLVTSPIKENLSVPVDVGRGKSGVSDGGHTYEERLRVTSPNESSTEVQTESGLNRCVICKQSGELLCCDGKGCKSSYHLSCLSPPLQDIPPGVWLCHFCFRKKVELGVYSVSDGIESVWDVEEEMQNGKQYFVKYKGLAHVHNRWVPESQILLEAPMLVANFERGHQKEKATRWKQEWAEPHRLLQKRQTVSQSLADGSSIEHGHAYCYHEWLVKWKGLGYEHATWELEKSPFLCSSDARVLIHDFENRHEEARRICDPLRAEKALQVKKSSFHKLTKLADDFPAGIDNDHLNSVNRLREFWHKSQNAIFIDDQERIIKPILFISSLKSHTCQPILVISTIASLSLWETDFMRLAPSINVVVYTGNKNIRKLIRTSEFYDEGGRIMFQVLLSHPDAVIEDLDYLDCIGWEVQVIDDCQNPRVSKHLEEFKNLSTEFRLLLLSGQLKETVAEYLNFLSFLESGLKVNDSSSSKYGPNDTAGTLAILKGKLTRHVAYERKPGSSKFLEYWVPVQLSNVQLEQYCSALISNSTALRSCSKVDLVGALRDILISTRKCCDHPYVLDGSLQSSLMKDLPADKYLDMGVNASGKLHLLDKFLQEIKNQGLRVLILFQSIGGAGRNSIGDILDDFVRQRFGPDSYERVDNGLSMSRKLTALSKFNDKANGRFVFLIENRACLPSIKLSSLDAVVIYSSDWNPLNDLRALQKIHIESSFEHVKVFRFYSSCTVEEKVLIFARQDIILDSNIRNINPSNSHLLLSWGALSLFNELNEFHQQNVHDYFKNSIEKCFLNDSTLKFLNDVVVELVQQLPRRGENNSYQCLLLIKAQQSGASYSRNISLVSERNGICALDKDPSSFWSDLLDNRYPDWRFISEPSQRIRRKVQRFEEPIKVPEVEKDEARKKRRKLTTNTVDPNSLQAWLEDKTKGMVKDAEVLNDSSPCRFNQQALISTTTPTTPSSTPMEPETYGSLSSVGKNCMPNSDGTITHVTSYLRASSTPDAAAEPHKFPIGESEGRRNAQKVLHLRLKPEISELCDTLKLHADVKDLAYTLLEYIMNNHHVDQDPDTILQAFKLSLCWRAASFLKHKVDHKECLALAKKYLRYTCSEEQVGSVYSRLRMLKKKFSIVGALRHEDKPNSLENQSSLSRKEDGRQQLHGGISESASSYLQESEVKEQAPAGQSPSEAKENLISLQDALLKKRVDLIDTICSKRKDAFLLRKQVELFDFNARREEAKARLKSAHDDLLELIRSVHTDDSIRNDKILLLNKYFSKMRAELDQHMKCQNEKLMVMLEDAEKMEQNIRDQWLEEAKAGTLAEDFELLPLVESGFRLEECKEVVEAFESHDGSRGRTPVSRSATDRMCTDIFTFPGIRTGASENDLDSSSTFSNGRLEDAQIHASHSRNTTEIGTISEIVETVPPNVVVVESTEPTRTFSEIPRPGSGLVCDVMEMTAPGISIGTTENQLDMPSTFSTGRMEDVQAPPSHSSNTTEVEAIQANRILVEIPETLLYNNADVESIEPNETSPEIPATMPAGNTDIPTDNGSSFSESVMNVSDNQPDTTRLVPLETSRRIAENQETVPHNIVASGEPNEISAETPADILPAGDDVITRDAGTPFFEADDMNILANQVDQNETSTVNPLTIPCSGDRDMAEDGGAPVPESDVMNAVGNQHVTMHMQHMMPSVATSLLQEGPAEIRIDSSVTTTEALVDRNIHEGEANPEGAHMRSSALQHSVGLRSTPHALRDSCCGNSARPNLVLPVGEHDMLSLDGRTECEEGPSSPLTTGPYASLGHVLTPQFEPTVKDTQTSNSTHNLVSPIATFSTEGGLCTEVAHSSQLLALSMPQPNMAEEMQVEECNPLSPQSILHPVMPAETLGILRPENMSCSPTSQTEVLVQQSIRTSRVSQERGDRLLQILPMASCIQPHQLHPDPLQNELVRLQKQAEHHNRMYEDKKRQRKLECEEELDKVRKKYEAMLKDDEAEFHQQQKMLETIYSKVLVNKILAEQFRTKFIDPKAGTSSASQARSSSPMQQFLQASNPLHAQGPPSTSGSFHIPTSANLPSAVTPSRASTSLPLCGSGATQSHIQTLANLPPAVTPARPSTSLPLRGSGATQAHIPTLANLPPATTPAQISAGSFRHNPSVVSRNLVRPQFSNNMLQVPPSHQGATDARAPAARAMAPHLHRFGPRSSMMPPILPPTSTMPSVLPPNFPPTCTTPPVNPPRLSNQHPTNMSAALLSATTAPPLSGKYSPVGSGQLPFSRVELSRDLGATTSLAADLPKLPVNDSEMATSTVVATPPAASTDPVVCLSDDE
ncbi:uncharacterized protein A4U43_C01F8260 [Asparagus officinalis]|uniref:Uncharacterized protein n=1 Tax=Asparagus officinalis TaxID=4686 RepID=A0A5P1FPI6_ASPOF|nr:uncharacterized protein LOC109851599 [Asparagus officinalis]XP_020277418.1 uncharacterized protein LOC109851599 [Asparagus officinalis]ONK79623.1 uncharacterized protein A4U43_C01F8260 [Asparagus officinalis]